MINVDSLLLKSHGIANYANFLITTDHFQLLTAMIEDKEKAEKWYNFYLSEAFNQFREMYGDDYKNKD